MAPIHASARGWLQKLGTNGKWQKRYFVLDGDRGKFEYGYGTLLEKEGIGRIAWSVGVGDIARASVTDEREKKWWRKGWHAFTVYLIDESSITLATHSAAGMYRWIYAIRDATYPWDSSLKKHSLPRIDTSRSKETQSKPASAPASASGSRPNSNEMLRTTALGYHGGKSLAASSTVADLQIFRANSVKHDQQPPPAAPLKIVTFAASPSSDSPASPSPRYSPPKSTNPHSPTKSALANSSSNSPTKLHARSNTANSISGEASSSRLRTGPRPPGASMDDPGYTRKRRSMSAPLMDLVAASAALPPRAAPVATRMSTEEPHPVAPTSAAPMNNSATDSTPVHRHRRTESISSLDDFTAVVGHPHPDHPALTRLHSSARTLPGPADRDGWSVRTPSVPSMGPPSPPGHASAAKGLTKLGATWGGEVHSATEPDTECEAQSSSTTSSKTAGGDSNGSVGTDRSRSASSGDGSTTVVGQHSRRGSEVSFAGPGFDRIPTRRMDGPTPAPIPPPRAAPRLKTAATVVAVAQSLKASTSGHSISSTMAHATALGSHRVTSGDMKGLMPVDTRPSRSRSPSAPRTGLSHSASSATLTLTAPAEVSAISHLSSTIAALVPVMLATCPPSPALVHTVYSLSAEIGAHAHSLTSGPGGTGGLDASTPAKLRLRRRAASELSDAIWEIQRLLAARGAIEAGEGEMDEEEWVEQVEEAVEVVEMRAGQVREVYAYVGGTASGKVPIGGARSRGRTGSSGYGMVEVTAAQ
ncbi:hypothetical protein HDU93_008835 [Gonapodya sp. JEL0774]|nr:hypothetical protein HDU93_008835 [Gonapodya sp. JEL0774]